MPVVLPPPPTNEKQGSFIWLEWFRKLRAFVTESGSVPWYVINFANSNITDIAGRSHNNLQSIQGGSTGEAYHLDSSQHTLLTSGISTRNIEYNIPTAGFTYTISNSTNSMIFEPAGTLATGTVTMPASPVNQQIVSISTTQTITALTHSPNTGQTLNGALTTLAANGFASWIYYSSTSTWYRIG